jgi:hypothetical protein
MDIILKQKGFFAYFLRAIFDAPVKSPFGMAKQKAPRSRRRKSRGMQRTYSM